MRGKEKKENMKEGRRREGKNEKEKRKKKNLEEGRSLRYVIK